jgi:hypothetical protein
VLTPCPARTLCSTRTQQHQRTQVLSPQHQAEMRRYLHNHQNSDGGFGLHIEGESTMFGTGLRWVWAEQEGPWRVEGGLVNNSFRLTQQTHARCCWLPLHSRKHSYVTLRLLGEGPDAPAVVAARKWVSASRLPGMLVGLLSCCCFTHMPAVLSPPLLTHFNPPTPPNICTDPQPGRCHLHNLVGQVLALCARGLLLGRPKPHAARDVAAALPGVDGGRLRPSGALLVPL